MTTPAFDSSEYRSDLSSAEINNAIKKGPPVQRASIADSYCSQKVQWLVSLRSARDLHKNGLELLSLTMTATESAPWITAIVDPEQIPWIKTLPTTKKMWIGGAISEVEYNLIHLTDAVCRLAAD